MNFDNKKAIYLQIADLICENILRGVWQAGQRIPSIRDMAGECQVNHNTVMRTYNELESLDIIKLQRGLGYSVSDEAIKHILSLKRKEFYDNDLPKFFKSIEALNIDFNELLQLYEQRK